MEAAHERAMTHAALTARQVQWTCKQDSSINRSTVHIGRIDLACTSVELIALLSYARTEKEPSAVNSTNEHLLIIMPENNNKGVAGAVTTVTGNVRGSFASLSDPPDSLTLACPGRSCGRRRITHRYAL